MRGDIEIKKLPVGPMEKYANALDFRSTKCQLGCTGQSDGPEMLFPHHHFTAIMTRSCLIREYWGKAGSVILDVSLVS